MADKKNIVIKVKYPNALKNADPESSVLEPGAEWDIKKIAIAALVVLATLALLFFWVGSDKQEAPQEQIAEVAPKPAEPAVVSNGEQGAGTIVRSILSYKITNNEPEDEVKLPLKISKKGSTWVYYFVELKNMKDKTVTHEWLLNGDLVSKKKIKISDNRWRTASKQVFSYTSETSWTVRLVDDQNNVLDEKHFDVVFE